MAIDLEQHGNAYVHLYPDCVAVKGTKRSAIYDFTRKEIILFQTEYFRVLEYLSRNRIGSLTGHLVSAKEKKRIGNFIDYLHNNELITLTENKS